MKNRKIPFYMALSVGSIASVLTPLFVDELAHIANSIERFGVLLILLSIIIILLEAMRERDVKQNRRNHIFLRRLRLLEKRMATSEKVQNETLKIATELLRRSNDNQMEG